MANKRGKADVDAEVDLHGLTAEQMRLTLQQRWPAWRGMRQVRIIHGRGETLKPAVERWCTEMGIPYALDSGNAGSTRLFPSQRILPDPSVGTTLGEKGLQLTPEELAYLRDPQSIERARQEAQRRKQEEERRHAAEAADRAAQRRRDEMLWQAEMARLTVLDKRRSPHTGPDTKPRPPVVLPPAEIKHQEGYWRAELVRVADAEPDTLIIQKRHGLEKLVPPLEASPASPASGASNAPPVAPSRDKEADQALFEAEMARLTAGDPGATRRAKRG